MAFPRCAFLVILSTAVGCQRADHAAAQPSPLSGRATDALSYIFQEQDWPTKGTVVYDDYASGDAGFYPSNIDGDFGDVTIDDNVTNSPAGGTSCFKITYNPRGSQKWASLAFVYPDRNRGEQAGRPISGAKHLTGWIRSDRDDVAVDLSIGGLNLKSNPTTQAFQDKFDAGLANFKLDTQWHKFTIDVPDGNALVNVLCGFRISISRAQCGGRQCSIFLDEITYDDLSPDALRLIRSYTPEATAVDDPIRNSCFLYDNALCLILFCSLHDDKGEGDRRATLLADAMVWAQQHDRMLKNRRNDLSLLGWRNASCAGPLRDPATNEARVPAIYDQCSGAMREDRYAVSPADCGNNAWASIACLAAHSRLEKGRREDYPYLRAALFALRWVDEQCRVDDANGGGYSGGFEGFDRTDTNPTGPERRTWRSTEHNLDLYVAFTQLDKAMKDAESEGKGVGRDHEPNWTDCAQNAKQFVLKMYDADTHSFFMGTRDSGPITKSNKNQDMVPSDACTWSLLAMGHDPEFRKTTGWSDPRALPPTIDFVEKNCREVIDGHRGYKFSCKGEGKGIFPEGCCHLAACYKYLGKLDGANEQPGRAEQMFGRANEILTDVAEFSPTTAAVGPVPGAGISPSTGGIVAAWPDLAYTGLQKEFFKGVVGPWTYPHRAHIGASAWLVLAERGVNPYWLDGPLSQSP